MSMSFFEQFIFWNFKMFQGHLVLCLNHKIHYILKKSCFLSVENVTFFKNLDMEAKCAHDLAVPYFLGSLRHRTGKCLYTKSYITHPPQPSTHPSPPYIIKTEFILILPLINQQIKYPSYLASALISCQILNTNVKFLSLNV